MRARARRDGGDDRRGAASRLATRSSACPAARRLRDADRQPRGRHAARARASSPRPTSSSARTRATRAGCSSGTGSRPGSSRYHEHNEARATAELLPRLAGGRAGRARVGRGPAGGERSGRAAGRAALEAGVPVTVLPGPSAVETALVASGLVGERYRSSASCRAASGRWRRCGRSSRAWPLPVVAFESPQRLRRRCARSPRSRPSAGGGLPGADEAVRGGRARHGGELAERFAEPPKGEITLVLGRGWAGRRADEGRPRRPSPSSSRAGDRRGRWRPSSSRGSPRAPERLYDASLYNSILTTATRPPLPSDVHVCQSRQRGVRSMRRDLLACLVAALVLAPAAPAPGRGRPTGAVLRPFCSSGASLGGRPAPRDRRRRRRGRARARAGGGRRVVRRHGPGSGRTSRSETADGYAVTLIHLGSIAVHAARRSRRATSSGRSARAASPRLAAVRPSRRPRTADPEGYVDPLGLLPRGGAACPAGAAARQSLRRRPALAPAPPAGEPVLPREPGLRLPHGAAAPAPCPRRVRARTGARAVAAARRPPTPVAPAAHRLRCPRCRGYRSGPRPRSLASPRACDVVACRAAAPSPVSRRPYGAVGRRDAGRPRSGRPPDAFERPAPGRRAVRAALRQRRLDGCRRRRGSRTRAGTPALGRTEQSLRDAPDHDRRRPPVADTWPLRRPRIRARCACAAACVARAAGGRRTPLV